MSTLNKIKGFFKKIVKKISEFWNSEKFEDFREDFKNFALNFGKESYDQVLKPFIIEQVKKYAKELISGDMKFSNVKNAVKENFNGINFKDYIIDKLIQDVVFELKVTKQI